MTPIKQSISETDSLLPTVLNIFSQWKLTDVQVQNLLGLNSEETRHGFLERLSQILGIYKSLQILFPDKTFKN